LGELKPPLCFALHHPTHSTMGSDWTPAAFLGDRVRLSLIEFMSICLSRAAPRLQQLKKMVMKHTILQCR